MNGNKDRTFGTSMSNNVGLHSVPIGQVHGPGIPRHISPEYKSPKFTRQPSASRLPCKSQATQPTTGTMYNPLPMTTPVVGLGSAKHHPPQSTTQMPDLGKLSASYNLPRPTPSPFVPRPVPIPTPCKNA